MTYIARTDRNQHRDHIHVLVRDEVTDQGTRYLYRCRDCGQRLQRKSGVLATHSPAQCLNTDSWYRASTTRRGGHWVELYCCPTCNRQGKFHRNYLGQRKVMCDGVKFTKETVEPT